MCDLNTCLVTGGAGFIGSHLAQALCWRGDRVRVLDDLSSGRAENLGGLDAELVRGDVRDPAAVAGALQGVEIVFHLAARVSVAETQGDPLGCYAVNLNGSLVLLEAARAAGVRRVVLASSAAVYGDAGETVDEQTPARPVSPYGASKLAMEGAASMYAEAYGVPAVCLRFFNVYGPRQAPDSPYAAVIPLMLRRMLAGLPPTIDGDGRQTRDFIFVRDVVRGCLLAAERGGPGGAVYNLASGRSVSILELAHTLQRLVAEAPPPLFGPPRPGDIRFSAADIGQAAAALGFRPETGLEEGLRETVEWFRR